MTSSSLDRSRTMLPPEKFPRAILEFQDSFVQESGSENPWVRVILVNGEVIYLKGLRIDPSPTLPGWSMFRNALPPSSHALVARDEEILRVDFEILVPEPEPPPRPPLGFSA